MPSPNGLDARSPDATAQLDGAERSIVGVIIATEEIRVGFGSLLIALIEYSEYFFDAVI